MRENGQGLGLLNQVFSPAQPEGVSRVVDCLLDESEVPVRSAQARRYVGERRGYGECGGVVRYRSLKLARLQADVAQRLVQTGF